MILHYLEIRCSKKTAKNKRELHIFQWQLNALTQLPFILHAEMKLLPNWKVSF